MPLESPPDCLPVAAPPNCGNQKYLKKLPWSGGQNWAPIPLELPMYSSVYVFPDDPSSLALNKFQLVAVLLGPKQKTVEELISTVIYFLWTEYLGCILCHMLTFVGRRRNKSWEKEVDIEFKDTFHLNLLLLDESIEYVYVGLSGGGFCSNQFMCFK